MYVTKAFRSSLLWPASLPHLSPPRSTSPTSSPDWARTTPANSGVPATLFAKAMTSLPFHYRDNLNLLNLHLREEHQLNLAESPNVPRAHLCCGDYRDGRAIKKALTETAVERGSDGGVRTALNHAEGYCAIAHLSPLLATAAPAVIHSSARCSPLTHASKEPLALLSPTSSDSAMTMTKAEPSEIRPASFFGLTLGTGLLDGHERGLIVTMSPGTLPTGTRGGMNRKLSAAAAAVGGGGVESLEQRWKATWASARGRDGARDFVEWVPWTSSKRKAAAAGSRRRLAAVDGAGPVEILEDDGVENRADEFHGGKARGYRAAFEHLSGKMGVVEEEEEVSLFGPCGLDGVEFVHPRDDVVYLRCGCCV